MKRYEQLCGVARALDVVGERWTLLVLRDLLLGPQRYGQLLRRLDGITTNLLAKRLHDLVDVGVVEATTHDGHEAYALTAKGRALEPAILALAEWGTEHGPPCRARDRGEARWLMVALKAKLASTPRAFTARVIVDDERYALRARVDEIDLVEGDLDAPALQLAGTKSAFREWLVDGASFTSLQRRGALEVDGDERALATLLDALRA